jgi:pSer/pThr/pTyr-binding forkhead associated (FHA) protein
MRVFLERAGERFELSEGEIVVGRGVTCELRLDDEIASRRHLRVRVGPDTASVEDLGSTNGTRLNGQPLWRRTRLGDGDVLQLGNTFFIVRLDSDTRAGTKQRAPVDGPLPAGIVVREVGAREPSSPSQPTPLSCRRCMATLPVAAFRCPVCGLELEPEEPTLANLLPPKPRDRRRELRVATRIRVDYRSSNQSFVGTVTDLSHGGAFVASEVQDPVVTRCELTFFADEKTPVSVAGVVRHVVPAESGGGRPPGIGVEFKALDYLAERQISTLLGFRTFSSPEG